MIPEAVAIHIAPPQATWARCLVLRDVQRACPESPLRAVVHANPYASINVVVAGHVRADGVLLPKTFLTGPLTSPMDTIVESRLLSMTLVLQPWALEPLFSVRPDLLAQGWMDAHSHASPRLRAWCQSMHALASGRADVGAFWASCEADARTVASPNLALDGLVLEGVASAAAQCGCTPRQYRRRFQRLMGLGPAAWLQLARWEQATAPLLAQGPVSPSLAEVALVTGYSDQAHFTRATRSIAQTSPHSIRDAGRQGRLPWSLRPADVRFVQDAEEPSP